MKPWYQHPMVWLLITFPALAVIGGMITINLAIVSNDGLVEDDYYRRGMGINQDLARDRHAKKLALYAQFQLQENQQLDIKFSVVDNSVLPKQLKLKLMHTTRAGQDQTPLLQQTTTGQYRGVLEKPLSQGYWVIELSTDDWRIQGRLQTPNTHQAILTSINP